MAKPTRVMIAGHSLSLSLSLWRDLSPNPIKFEPRGNKRTKSGTTGTDDHVGQPTLSISFVRSFNTHCSSRYQTHHGCCAFPFVLCRSQGPCEIDHFGSVHLKTADPGRLSALRQAEYGYVIISYCRTHSCCSSSGAYRLRIGCGHDPTDPRFASKSWNILTAAALRMRQASSWPRTSWVGCCSV